MRCAACNQTIEPNRADADGVLRCACGAKIELAERRAARTHEPPERRVQSQPVPIAGDPYRAPVAVPAAPIADHIPFDLTSFARDDVRASCPRCLRALVRNDGGAGTCWECATCGGVFVDAAELGALRGRAGSMATPAVETHPTTPTAGPKRDLDAYVRCPVCRETMNRTVFGKRSGVVVDVCATHGTWFDPGELSRAIEFVENGGLEERSSDAIERDRRAATVRGAAAVIEASLLSDAAREARSIGRWEGRLSGRRSAGIMDVVFELLF